MGPANLAAPDAAPDLTAPAPVDPAELRRRVEAGEWVVDLRSRIAFAAGHVTGTYNVGLDGSFVTYLGWLLPWGTPVTLLGETTGQVAEAQRELVRIGVERPAAAVTGSPAAWTGGQPLRTMRRASFADLATARALDASAVTVVDVRRNSEWTAGHLVGAHHVPLHDLLRRWDDVPTPAPGGAIWVHCQSGYRASIAASILAAAGHEVVLIDDEFVRATEAGLEVDHPATNPGAVPARS
jgi:rhodanese-related sulfurtransferase